jgi:hypothetical protein
MKYIHQFFAWVFSNQIKNPKMIFTNTDSVKEKVYGKMRGQVNDQVWNQVNRRVFFQVKDHVYWQVYNQINPIRRTIKKEIRK